MIFRKPAVVYQSFLGTTKQYAQWLQEEFGGDIFTFSQAKDERLLKYETVIVASGTYAGWMPLTGFLKRKWPLLKDKKVIVVAVGIAPAEEPYSKKAFEKIPDEIRQKVKIFKIPGRWGKLTPAGEVKKGNLKKIIKSVLD